MFYPEQQMYWILFTFQKHEILNLFEVLCMEQTNSILSPLICSISVIAII